MPISSTRLAEMKASAEKGDSASAEDTLILLAEIERMTACERGAGGAKRIGPIGDPKRPVTTYGLAPDGTVFVTGGYGARGIGASTR